MVSTDFLQFFPHDKIRGGQKDLINDLYLALSSKKILIAHAPTGLGKTASALSVALFEAQKNKKKLFFLTNRHTQPQIAVHTSKLISRKIGKKIICADLIGKRWMCSHDTAGLFGNEFNEFCKTIVERGECEFYNNVKNKKELTVEAKKTVKEAQIQGPLHNEEILALGRQEKMCSYELSLALAKDAVVIIGDYFYLFNPFVQANFISKLSIELEDIILIVDEGHNLPGRISEMLSIVLTSNGIKNAVLEAKKYGYNGLIFWLQELMRILHEMGNFSNTDTEREKLVSRTGLISQINTLVDYDEFINQLEIAAEEIKKKQRKSYLGGIAHFLSSWKGEDAGFARIISQKAGMYGEVTALSYLCLDPRLVSGDIFNKVHAGVVMSGTLQPTFMYKDILGIERGVEREYNSPFPVENKLSLIIPETSTKYTVRGDAMYRRIAQICSNLAGSIPGNAAFFFPSYQLRDKIANFLTVRKKLFWEKAEMSKEEKEALLSQFKAEKEAGGVLLGVTGANFAEGVDFPGDLLQGVVVVGLPLAKPDLRTKEVIKYYEEKFGKGWDYGYIYPAMSKCIQSAGRCIRSETDKGVVIFLDERFTWQNYYNCLPREGLIVSRDYERLLKEFFGKS